MTQHVSQQMSSIVPSHCMYLSPGFAPSVRKSIPEDSMTHSMLKSICTVIVLFQFSSPFLKEFFHISLPEKVAEHSDLGHLSVPEAIRSYVLAAVSTFLVEIEEREIEHRFSVPLLKSHNSSSTQHSTLQLPFALQKELLMDWKSRFEKRKRKKKGRSDPSLSVCYGSKSMMTSPALRTSFERGIKELWRPGRDSKSVWESKKRDDV